MTETMAIVKDRSFRMGITMQTVAGIVGVNKDTLRKKCNSPQYFTGWELKNLFHALRMPEEEKATIMREVLA